MRLLLLLAIAFFTWSCGNDKKMSEKNDQAQETMVADIKTGGLYLFKNKDNTYYLTKVLAVDEEAVHLRTYRDTFQTKPADIRSEDLTILMGHAPLDKKGFLAGSPELIKVEAVKDAELEGYKIYLEAMGK